VCRVSRRIVDPSSWIRPSDPGGRARPRVDVRARSRKARTQSWTLKSDPAIVSGLPQIGHAGGRRRVSIVICSRTPTRGRDRWSCPSGSERRRPPVSREPWIDSRRVPRGQRGRKGAAGVQREIMVFARSSRTLCVVESERELFGYS